MRVPGLLAGLCFGAAALAQQAPYAPASGQPGKDVVWVPTPQVTAERMLDLARVGPKDFVVDLGSGDGRLVIAAAKRGARALGVEFNPELVELSRRNAEQAGVAGRARFVAGDFFKTDFSTASVVTLFLLTEINVRLRPKLLALRPGTRIVGNTFNLGDWAPDESAEVPYEAGCNESWCTVFLWIVPAKVVGTWKTPQGEVSFSQRYQKLTGTLSNGSGTLPLAGKVRGLEISFVAGGHKYSGRLKNGALELH